MHWVRQSAKVTVSLAGGFNGVLILAGNDGLVDRFISQRQARGGGLLRGGAAGHTRSARRSSGTRWPLRDLSLRVTVKEVELIHRSSAYGSRGRRKQRYRYRARWPVCWRTAHLGLVE